MENRYSAGKRVAVVGIAVNILLLIIKLAVGYTADSQAMIADGFNSMGDVFASVVTLLGSIYAAKPSDNDHVWGHGKAEFIASMMIGFAMIAMAIYTISGSVASLIEHKQMDFSYWLVAVAVVTISCKGVLFAYTRKKAVAYGSLLIEANAKDHRNDVIVTSGTLAAILLSLAGQFWVDGLVGLVISCWIIYSGYTILRDAAKVLMDSNADVDMLDEYKNEILEIPGIDHLDSVVAKPVGANYILIVKISVNRDMNVMQSHEIAKQVELHIMHLRPEVEDVIVHINPDLPHNTKHS